MTEETKMPRERPILFSGPMVRAIFEGRKTQTRRIIRHPRGRDTIPPHLRYMLTRDGHALLSGPDYPDGDDDEVKCPYGQVGDRLWVRETWCLADPDYGRYPGDGRPSRPDGRWCWYAATEPEVEPTGDQPGRSPWRPSIYMPRWASRITLEVTGVRVQQLQQITAADARAEGCKTLGVDPYDSVMRTRKNFRDLWDEINGPGSWARDPWVWVVEFSKAGD